MTSKNDSLTTDTSTIPAEYRARIDAYWADFLGCTTEQLRSPDHLAIASAGKDGLFAIKAGLESGWKAAVAPGLEDVPLDALAALPLDDADSVAAANHVLSKYGFDDVYGISQVTYCTSTQSIPRLEGDYRRLTPDDREQVMAFRAAMNRDDWDFDDSDAWPVAFGIFEGDKLVCCTQVRVWDDTIGEIFTDTLPDYQSNGHGRILSAATLRWVLENTSWIPQGDFELTNEGSRRIAQSIGFQLYGWMIIASKS